MIATYSHNDQISNDTPVNHNSLVSHDLLVSHEILDPHSTVSWSTGTGSTNQTVAAPYGPADSSTNRIDEMGELIRRQRAEAEATLASECRFPEPSGTAAPLSSAPQAPVAGSIDGPSARSWRMRCECLTERHLMDLVEHVLEVVWEARGERKGPSAGPRTLDAESANPDGGPILIHVADYHEAVEIDRRLSAVKLRTHLASPFSNWTKVLGKLGTGQLDVIISTTTEIPHAEQIPWLAIYLPSALHLAMLTTLQMDWLGNRWFANHRDQQPPRLVVRRTVGERQLQGR